MRLAIFFYIFPNPSFKMTTSFANIARTTANTSKSYLCICVSCSSSYKLRKISNHQELGLYMKNNI